MLWYDEDQRLQILGLGTKGLSLRQNTSKGRVMWLKVQKLWMDVKGAALGGRCHVLIYCLAPVLTRRVKT